MRINEDYMDVIDQEDTYDNVSNTLDKDLRDEYFCHQIDLILSGEQPESRPDFRHASDAIYPVDNIGLKNVISAISKTYRLIEYLNLNWIDTSGVTSMANLFENVFDPKIDVNISRWDTSHVEDMKYMFSDMIFNNDISRWDVSSVKIMEGMFSYSSFNGDISGWDTRSLYSCRLMFEDSNFNRDISGWDISNVQDMYKMFYESKMNRDLSRWDLTGLSFEGTYNMFIGTPMQNRREWYPKGCRN